MNEAVNPAPRIFILEDEVAIALEIEASLRSRGYRVIGPAFVTDDAAPLLGETLDLAILDVGMAARAPETLLRPLVDRKVPIIFVSGYDNFALPDWVVPVATFPKPFRLEDLLDRLTHLLRRS